jgi:hypothetical protein
MKVLEQRNSWRQKVGKWLPEAETEIGEGEIGERC